MVGIVFPAQVAHAIFKRCDFKAHAVREAAFVSIVASLGLERELSRLTSGHGGGHTDDERQFDGFTSVDGGCGDRGIADGDVLLCGGGQGGYDIVGHGAAVVGVAKGKFGVLARVKSTIGVAFVDDPVIDGHVVGDFQVGCIGVDCEVVRPCVAAADHGQYKLETGVVGNGVRDGDAKHLG